MRSRASAGCAGAHELGQTAQTSLRYRHRTLPELRRQLKDHRRPFDEAQDRHRRSAGDCQNPYSSGPADPRPGRAASRFIPDNLRAENRLPTQADGAARSEFERAARSGTLRAPPTTTPPKPAEATLGFSSTRKTIDNSPGWRYCSGQKKGALNFLYRETHVATTTMHDRAGGAGYFTPNAVQRIKIISLRFFWMKRKSAKFTTCFVPTRKGWSRRSRREARYPSLAFKFITLRKICTKCGKPANSEHAGGHGRSS